MDDALLVGGGDLFSRFRGGGEFFVRLFLERAGGITPPPFKKKKAPPSFLYKVPSGGELGG